MATRIRVTPSHIAGRVTQWKGTYGWIEPQCVIEHPDIDKHRGRIFIHAEDTVPKWRSLTVGSLVEFYLYYDGEGLGAEDCVARKVLRLTLPWGSAQTLFGEEGEKLPDFEQKMNVTMRAYQWIHDDGSQSELPFLLLEVWGRTQAIIEAVLEITKKNSRNHAEMLVPEGRLWKIQLGTLQEKCRSVKMSPSFAIIDPMPCRTVTMKGSREECSAALQVFISQACD